MNSDITSEEYVVCLGKYTEYLPEHIKDIKGSIFYVYCFGFRGQFNSPERIRTYGLINKYYTFDVELRWLKLDFRALTEDEKIIKDILE
jgi:hypothetical protein